jgi:hypothetical protein
MPVLPARANNAAHTLVLLILLATFGILTACNAGTDSDVPGSTASSVLGPQQLAIVINDADPLSIDIGEVTARPLPNRIACQGHLNSNQRIVSFVRHRLQVA